MSLTVGSLFAGIGGFDLAAERVGFGVKWQVEIDDYCTKVLEKHWPHVKRHRDIRTTTDLEPVDLICGGFPCQDISAQGLRAGLSAARSGLWREMARGIRLVRPRLALVENVAALLDRGMGEVLGDLADIGYDAEWDCIRACAFGAPHMRERVWIVAYPEGEGLPSRRLRSRITPSVAQSDDGIADTFWKGASEPGICGVANGIPDRPHRIRALGNAIVPQVAEWIFSRIKEAEERLAA